MADETLVGLFEAQVARTPEAPAVVCGDERLSYAALNERANRLAHMLRAEGVGPETIVGLCLERSVTLVVGLLGILKAGGAYLPLDPDYPADRLARMLDDAAPFCVLSAGAAVSALPTGIAVLDLDGAELAARLAAQPGDNPDRAAVGLSAQHPAYVIYTSGSTGKPKGVVVPHGALSNYLQRTTDAYFSPNGLGAAATLAPSFDGVISTLFTPWLAGQQLTLPRGEFVLEDIIRHAEQAGRPYELLKLTPSQLPLLEQALPSDGSLLLSANLMFGGEALTHAHVERLRSYFPQTDIINHYGPTETTVGCATYRITPDMPLPSGDVLPIGRPIWNAQVYVLDGHLRPLPGGGGG